MTGTLTLQDSPLDALGSVDIDTGLQRLLAAAEHIQHAEASLEVEASALVEYFRDARKACRDAEALNREAELQGATGSLYSPLNLGARVNKGLLEVYWFEQHKGRLTGKLAYRYIPRGRTTGHGYHLVQLLKHAKPYERDLVQRTEALAADLRARRAGLAELRRDLHKVTAMYQVTVDRLAAAGEGTTPTDDTSPLVPAREPGYT